MPIAISNEKKIEIINEYTKCNTKAEQEKLVNKYKYKDIFSLRVAISIFKNSVGIKNRIKRKYDFNTNEEKLYLIKRWDEASTEEKETIVKEYNTTYKNIANTISKYRKDLDMNMKYTIMKDEDKIKLIEMYNNAVDTEERKKLANEYGIPYKLIRHRIRRFRLQLNINEYVKQRFSDEEKINRINEWDKALNKNERIFLVNKYGYASYSSMNSSIILFRNQLQEKGLL